MKKFLFIYSKIFQVRKDYDLIKRKTNFTIIEASRDDVLAQKRKDPDPKEAFRYYQVRYIRQYR